ncbi:MAG: alpha/beta fold hydrolase BchO [Burkholderiaceae bacterium]
MIAQRLSEGLAMASRLQWEVDGQNWPHRKHSRFVHAGGLRWHVQQFGSPALPTALLVHGTGASSHSWRALASLLSNRLHVVVLDLPGHGFTEAPASPAQYSLPGMSALLHELVNSLNLDVRYGVGHSAGAAVLAWMCLENCIHPHKLFGINAALLPLGGAAGKVFSPIAKALWATGVAPHLFAWRASNISVVNRLLGTTGSNIDAQGRALYAQLVRNPAHVGAALAMMAHWDLPLLASRLAGLKTPLVQIVGMRDQTVRPSEAYRVRDLLPSAQIIALDALGHLAHEERPDLVDQALQLHAPTSGT